MNVGEWDWTVDRKGFDGGNDASEALRVDATYFEQSICNYPEEIIMVYGCATSKFEVEVENELHVITRESERCAKMSLICCKEWSTVQHQIDPSLASRDKPRTDWYIGSETSASTYHGSLCKSHSNSTPLLNGGSISSRKVRTEGTHAKIQRFWGLL